MAILCVVREFNVDVYVKCRVQVFRIGERYISIEDYIYIKNQGIVKSLSISRVMMYQEPQDVLKS